MKKVVYCVVVMGLFAAGSVCADLLQNGGFEIEGGSSWNALNWDNQSDIGRTDWAGHSGSYGMAGYGDGDGKWGYVTQKINSDYQSSSNVYTFSIWGMAEENFSSSGNEVYMKVSFYEDASELGNFTENIYSAFTASTDWNEYTMTVTNSAWTTANAVEVCFGYGQTVNDIAGNCGLRVDDASLVQVPEPASISMIILGLFGVFALRRQCRVGNRR